MAAGSLVLDDARTVTLGRVVTVLGAWDPERVLLFGSHARGEARPDRDLDILVVLPDRQPATRASLIDMRVAIGAAEVIYWGRCPECESQSRDDEPLPSTDTPHPRS